MMSEETFKLKDICTKVHDKGPVNESATTAEPSRSILRVQFQMYKVHDYQLSASVCIVCEGNLYIHTAPTP